MKTQTAWSVINTGILLAILGVVYSVPTLNFAEYERRIASLEEEWADTKTRLATLEARLKDQTVKPHIPQKEEMFNQVSGDEDKVAHNESRLESGPPKPLVLRDDLHWFANELKETFDQNMSWGAFRHYAGEVGLIPDGQLPEELVEALRKRFEKCILSRAVLSTEYLLQIGRWKDIAREANDYREVPIDLPHDEISAALKGWKGAGATTQERDTQKGLIRFFRFPHKDYPELYEHQVKLDNEYLSLVQDIAGILEG